MIADGTFLKNHALIAFAPLWRKHMAEKNESEMAFDFKRMPLHLLGEGLVLGMTPSRDQECAMAVAHVSP